MSSGRLADVVVGPAVVDLIVFLETFAALSHLQVDRTLTPAEETLIDSYILQLSPKWDQTTKLNLTHVL